MHIQHLVYVKSFAIYFSQLFQSFVILHLEINTKKHIFLTSPKKKVDGETNTLPHDTGCIEK